jgi:hypothetical protein
MSESNSGDEGYDGVGRGGSNPLTKSITHLLSPPGGPVGAPTSTPTASRTRPDTPDSGFADEYEPTGKSPLHDTSEDISLSFNVYLRLQSTTLRSWLRE